MHFRYSAVQMALLCLLLINSLAGEAQTSFRKKVEAIPFKSYTVGDKVPDLVFKNLLNYKSEKVNLSELKGKLVLIDFWELNCSNCIAAFPKIQKIQQQFGDKVQVITVTSLATRKAFDYDTKQMPSMKGFSLPVVLQDDILHKYFPFEAISHVVWIDRNGIVKAITGTDYITPENVALALQDDHLPWPVKKEVIGFDYDLPVLGITSENTPVPSKLYYSAFTGYMDGVRPKDREIVDSSKGTVSFSFFNKALLAFCDGALNGSGTGYINPKYLILDVKDKSRYFWNSKTQYHYLWEKMNTYCYFVTLPLNLSKEQRKEFFKKDLTHWLDLTGISVRKEVREVPCYSLVLLRDNRKEVEAKGTEVETVNSGDSTEFRNEKLLELISNLNMYYNELPSLLSNGTNYPKDFRINMKFSKTAFSDIEQLRKELNNYGFDLVPSTTREEMYIVTESNL